MISQSNPKRTGTWFLLLPSALLFLLLVLLPTTTTASRAFPPWLGCEDTFTNGIPNNDEECYAVDSFICRWQFETGCREERATYYYYIGGYPTDYDYLRYHKIAVVASYKCNNETKMSCEIKVDNVGGEGPKCNRCTNNPRDYREVTLEDCSNVPGIFPPNENQTITVKAGEGYFRLASNETRCQHPYFDTPSSMPTSLPTTDASIISNSVAPSITPSPSYENTASPTEEEEEQQQSTSLDTPLKPAETDLIMSAPLKPAPPKPDPVKPDPVRIADGSLRGVTSPPTPPLPPTNIQTTIQDDQSTPAVAAATTSTSSTTRTLTVHPKLKFFIPLKTTLPEPSTLLTLMEDTNTFFRSLLHQHIPLLTGFAMSEITTSDTLEAADSSWFFNFTATLTMTQDNINTRDVATYMSNNHNLNQYLRKVLKPTFPHIHRVKAWVVAEGLAVVGEKRI